MSSSHIQPEPSDDQFANVQQDEHRLRTMGWQGAEVFLLPVGSLRDLPKLEDTRVICLVSRHRVGGVAQRGQKRCGPRPSRSS